ncbi:hypothetical protein Glove_46g156 [Diversispora epigaea]|uniref:Uncharacterized protein n=1 Tax=Diversispora epigaea TaxID=1348612 RepID=A0A397JEL5_9GLOM|nr:hypothetical protein Glove_46g156 [Diversispora epigaea]
MSANDKKKGKKKVFEIPKFLKNIKKKKKPEVLNPSVPEISNPPETVDSLHKYEISPGQAQKFLDRVVSDFRWPISMSDIDRGTVFFYIADESAVEFDDEMGFNMIFFYENLDKGTFDEHKDDWVLIYKQEIIKYGSECTRKELEDLEEEMPGSIYFPIDQKRHEDVKVLPARTVKARRTENEHMVKIQIRKLGTTNSVIIDYNFRDPAEGYKLYKSVIDSGAPETILPYHGGTLAVFMPQVTDLHLWFLLQQQHLKWDNDTWSKWVRTNTLRVWQRKPGNHIDSSLVGCDKAPNSNPFKKECRYSIIGTKKFKEWIYGDAPYLLAYYATDSFVTFVSLSESGSVNIGSSKKRTRSEQNNVRYTDKLKYSTSHSVHLEPRGLQRTPSNLKELMQALICILICLKTNIAQWSNIILHCDKYILIDFDYATFGSERKDIVRKALNEFSETGHAPETLIGKHDTKLCADKPKNRPTASDALEEVIRMFKKWYPKNKRLDNIEIV